MPCALGPDHPETARLIARLAGVRRSQGMYVESVKLYRRALPILEAGRSAGDRELPALRSSYDRAPREASRAMLFAR